MTFFLGGGCRIKGINLKEKREVKLLLDFGALDSLDMVQYWDQLITIETFRWPKYFPPQ